MESMLRKSGYQSVIVSTDHVVDLRDTIEGGRRAGLIDAGVYTQYVSYFEKMQRQEIGWARSIIAVAVPRPMLELVFNIDGKRKSGIIPPTYEHSIDGILAKDLEDFLRPRGFAVSPASLPQKLLAVRSGLAKYGKNNITYVQGMGSFYRLLSFYTDLACDSDTWLEPQMLDECARCTACMKKCPTGAIDSERFQLHAELCLTYYNESSEPFPEWIKKTWHHCLIGCLNCQRFCPLNKDVRSWTVPFGEFTEEETGLLLNGVPKKDLPAGLVSKLEYTSLLDDPVMLARNLRTIFEPKD